MFTQVLEVMKNDQFVVIKFLQIDHETKLVTWSPELRLPLENLSVLSSGQIKRVFNVMGKKIIFLKEKSNLGIIAICVCNI